MGDVRLERRDRLGRRFLTPQLVDEVFQGDDRVRAQQQDAEHSTLLGTAQVEEPSSRRDLERPENPELHLPSPSPPVKVVRTPYKAGRRRHLVNPLAGGAAVA
jgi:hypothetical protein